jgi:hypothetical protein
MSLSLCESVHASGTSPWHLRVLTDKGPKHGGGIDTASLCDVVKPPYGWDLNVSITPASLESVCQGCLKAARDRGLIQ